MIKLENVVLTSPEQMSFIIQGLRNPMNSHNKIDSFECTVGECDICERFIDDGGCPNLNPGFHLGNNDHSLMQRLANAGTDHRKFMRMMPVYVRITAPLYWWKEFDTYKVVTVANSCSTMHKSQEKEFTFEDFSCEHLIDTCLLEQVINELNIYRDIYNNYDKQTDNYKKEFSKKDLWWQMIQLLPSSYNQTRNVMMNYEVLANIYKSRKNHKLDEWVEFCKWIETLPYSELITGKEEVDNN